MWRLSLNIVLFFTLTITSLNTSAQRAEENGQFNKISCRDDSSQSYALYLPHSFSDTMYWPLIIFLDPVARGDYPVSLYRHLADEFGLILTGSYSSKNFDPSSSEKAFVSIYNDVVNKFPVNGNAVWICGFSGGARVAASLGMMYKQITGVIACGAGFSDDEPDSAISLNKYAAIVGRRDMNYSEMLDNSFFLDKNKVNNIMLVSEGGHQWPETDIMKIALTWGLGSPKNDSVSSWINKYFEYRIKAFKAGYYFQPWLELNQLAKIPGCKIHADSFTNVISRMGQFEEDKAKFEEAEQRELNYINKISLLISGLLTENGKADQLAWQQCESDLNSLMLSGNRYITAAATRCIDHSYRSLSESYFYLMENGRYSKALNLAEAWSFLQLPGQNPWYMMARASAMMGKRKWTVQQLKEAVVKKTLNKEQVLHDKALLNVLSQKEIEAIVQ